MRLSTLAVATSAAILLGGTILLVGLVNLAVPSFGAGYLALMSSFHPGFRAGGGLGDILLGAVAGLVDGALIGFLFAVLHNRLLGVFESGLVHAEWRHWPES